MSIIIVNNAQEFINALVLNPHARCEPGEDGEIRVCTGALSKSSVAIFWRNGKAALNPSELHARQAKEVAAILANWGKTRVNTGQTPNGTDVNQFFEGFGRGRLSKNKEGRVADTGIYYEIGEASRLAGKVVDIRKLRKWEIRAEAYLLDLPWDATVADYNAKRQGRGGGRGSTNSVNVVGTETGDPVIDKILAKNIYNEFSEQDHETLSAWVEAQNGGASAQAPAQASAKKPETPALPVVAPSNAGVTTKAQLPEEIIPVVKSAPKKTEASVLFDQIDEKSPPPTVEFRKAKATTVPKEVEEELRANKPQSPPAVLEPVAAVVPKEPRPTTKQLENATNAPGHTVTLLDEGRVQKIELVIFKELKAAFQKGYDRYLQTHPGATDNSKVGNAKKKDAQKAGLIAARAAVKHYGDELKILSDAYNAAALFSPTGKGASVADLNEIGAANEKVAIASELADAFDIGEAWFEVGPKTGPALPRYSEEVVNSKKLQLLQTIYEPYYESVKEKATLAWERAKGGGNEKIEGSEILDLPPVRNVQAALQVRSYFILHWYSALLSELHISNGTNGSRIRGPYSRSLHAIVQENGKRQAAHRLETIKQQIRACLTQVREINAELAQARLKQKDAKDLNLGEAAMQEATAQVEAALTEGKQYREYYIKLICEHEMADLELSAATQYSEAVTKKYDVLFENLIQATMKAPIVPVTPPSL